MIIATTLMLGVNINVQLSKAEIEKKAFDYGMKYPEDFKVINSKDVSK